MAKAIWLNESFLLICCVIASSYCQTYEQIQALRDVLQWNPNEDINEAKQLKGIFEEYAVNSSIGDVSKVLPHLFKTTLKNTNLPNEKWMTKSDNQCLTDIRRLFSGISWESLNILDSWGKVPPGIFFGDKNWVGSYQQCIRTKVPANNISHHSFQGKYCSAPFYIANNNNETQFSDIQQSLASGYLPSSVTAGGVTIGFCFPDSCRWEIIWYITNITLGMIPGYPVREGYVTCQPIKGEKLPLTPRAKGIIALLSIIGAFLLVGTLYDVIYYQHKLSKAIQLRQVSQNAEANGSAGGDDVPILDAHKSGPMSCDQLEDDVRQETEKQQSIVGKILMAFSIPNNIKRLCTVQTSRSSSDSTLDAVHGIRFLSMSWVILGHTYFFGSIIGLKNIVIAQDLIQRFSMQAILGATVSVDSFFVLSGVLVSFLALREMKKKGGVCGINWPLFYIHRYWRLTVPYMLVLGTWVSLSEYTGRGPLWPDRSYDLNTGCNESWWSNLLYVNNLYTKNPCMGWSWYLANDMQFYWVTPIFIIPLFIKWWAGLSISLAALICSIIVTFCISFHHKFAAGLQGEIVHPGPNDQDQFNAIYQAPWCRIGPYIIGVLLGYILYATNRRAKLNKWLLLLGWAVAATINMLVVYGLYDYSRGKVELSNVACAFYNALHRTAWGIGLCWVIFVCTTGQGGYVNSLLGWSGLVPLSRLTYMAYLVHPIVMTTYLLQMKYLFNYDDYSIIYLFLGHLVFSYMVAFVACLMFEAPFMVLEKIIIEEIRKAYNRYRNRYVSIQSD